jgi:hypothetical protein
MIADAVYLAIAGIAFCHAAGRSIFSSRLKVCPPMSSSNPVVPDGLSEAPRRLAGFNFGTVARGQFAE